MEPSKLLQDAADCINDRASERDTDKERSMSACVKAFNAMFNKDITEQQGWLFMVLLKMSRAKGGSFKLDDYVDMAAYAALAAEVAEVTEPDTEEVFNEFISKHVVFDESDAERLFDEFVSDYVVFDENQVTEIGDLVSYYHEKIDKAKIQYAKPVNIDKLIDFLVKNHSVQIQGDCLKGMKLVP